MDMNNSKEGEQSEPLLSLVMIVKNNALDLERCLKSVQGLVDEIIIVDTGSTDKTKEIAEKYTYKIFDFKWTNNFSDAKNYALKWAKGRWIINLDADESLSKSDHKKILDAINNASLNTAGFTLIQRNYTNKIGQFGLVSSKGDHYNESKIANGFVPRKIVRLFKKDSRVHFTGAVHDSVELSIIANGGLISHLDLPIHHYGMLNRDGNERTKMYIGIEKENLRNGDFFQMYQLACQLHSIKENKEALKWLDKAISLNPKFHLAWLEKGTINMEMGELKKAKKFLETAKDFGEHEMIYGHLAITHAQLGELDKAVEYFRKAIKLNPKNADFYFNLGIALTSANRKTEAGLALKRAVELNPEYNKMVKID